MRKKRILLVAHHEQITKLDDLISEIEEKNETKISRTVCIQALMEIFISLPAKSLKKTSVYDKETLKKQIIDAIKENL